MKIGFVSSKSSSLHDNKALKGGNMRNFLWGVATLLGAAAVFLFLRGCVSPREAKPWWEAKAEAPVPPAKEEPKAPAARKPVVTPPAPAKAPDNGAKVAPVPIPKATPKVAAKPAPAPKPQKMVRHLVFYEVSLPIEDSPKQGESFMERRQRLVTNAVEKSNIPDDCKIVAVEGGYTASGRVAGGKLTLIAYELEEIPASEARHIPSGYIVPDGYGDRAIAEKAKALWEKRNPPSVHHSISTSYSSGRYGTNFSRSHSTSTSYKTRK